MARARRGRVHRRLRARLFEPMARTAGSSVTEVASIASTATASDGPRMRNMARPLASIAAKLTATASALATMAWPTRAMAAAMAVRWSSPARSLSRYRYSRNTA